MGEIRGQNPLPHQHFEGFGSDHQDVGGFPVGPRTITPGDVTMPHPDLETSRGAERPEPLLLIIDQGFQR